MKKILTIAQLLIGVVVLYFAFTMFWGAIATIFTQLGDVLKLNDFPSRMSLSPFNEYLQLIISIFIMWVVAVYTKKTFDRLSVSG